VRHLLEWNAIEVGVENFHRASDLPRRKSAAKRARYRSHASIALSDMDSDSEHDVVDKQLVGLLGAAEGRENRARKAGNDPIIDACARFVVQVANLRRFGVVGDRVQRRARQIEKRQ